MNTKELVFIIKKYPYMVAGGAIFLLFFMLWMISPDTKAQDEKKINELQVQLATFDRNEAQAKTLPEDLDAIRKMVNTVENNLMDPTETTDIFSYFIDIQQSIGISMEDPLQKGIFSTPNTLAKQKSQAKPALDLAIIQYELRLKGEFYKTLQFLEALRRGHYYTRITGFTLSRSKRLDDKSLETTIILNILGKQEA